MTTRNIATTLVVTLGLAACGGAGQNEQLGNVLGAVVGGLAGAQVGEGDGQLVAVGVGAVLGALVGGEIGRMMDEADLQLLADAQLLCSDLILKPSGFFSRRFVDGLLE